MTTPRNRRQRASRRRSRVRLWIGVLALADVVAFLLTVRAHLDFRAGANGPTVMSLGQVLGWIISVGLLVILAVVVLEALRTRRGR